MISASGGEVPIYTADSEIEIGLDLHEKPTEITSDKYVIDEKSEIISRIAPNTTVAQFKNNITANKEIVVLDKDGNVLKENAILGTGMQIKVGKTTQFKSIVIGDLDGDGEITILELAKIKLHYIDAKHIETEMELMAADLDADGEITINDIAQVKLVIIGLKVID